MNPTLTKIESGIYEHVSQANKTALRNAVTAGMKIMFDDKTHANMQLVKNPASRTDPVGTISTGVAGLVFLMYLHSKKTMKPEVMIMAGTIIMCHVFDFAERGLKMQITNEIIAETTKSLAEELFKKMEITPERLHEAVQEGHKEITDYKAKGGSIPHGVNI